LAQAIHKQADDPGLYVARAWVYYLRQDTGRAFADVRTAIRLAPANAEAGALRGVLYADTGKKSTRALADLTKAIRLDPKCGGLAGLSRALCLEKAAHLYRRRGEAYLVEGKTDHAIREFSKAIHLEPKEALFYWERGMAYMEAETDHAIRDFSKAIHLEPKEPRFHFERGTAYMDRRDYARAAADLRKAVRLEPTCVPARQELAWLQASCPAAEFRDGKRAVRGARRACELSEWKDTPCLEALAAAYAECGEFRKAMRWEKRAIEVGQQLPPGEQEIMRARLQRYRDGKAYRME
jgi:tetratricopeptide (TPR) repeat protein